MAAIITDARIHSRGHVDFEAVGPQWRARHAAPMYLNVLPEKKKLRAIPVDQGGGIRGGDHQTTKITLRGGAAVVWSPPASTIFMPGVLSDDVCFVETEIALSQSSSLEFIGKVNIPCAGASIRQRTTLDVDPDSEILFWEANASGRYGSGESWGFLKWTGSFMARLDDRVLFQENWVLDGRCRPHGPAGFGRACLWGSGFAYGERMVGRLREFGAGLEKPGNHVTFSKLCDAAAIVRMLSIVA